MNTEFRGYIQVMSSETSRFSNNCLIFLYAVLQVYYILLTKFEGFRNLSLGLQQAIYLEKVATNLVLIVL